MNTLRTALKELIANNRERVLSVKDIYTQFYNYYDLSEYQLEDDKKYPQARYKHEIRSILAKLVREGIAVRLGRDQYKAGNTVENKI